jgi:hypothetical protein
MKPSEVQIEVGTATMTCTAGEIGDTLAGLLAEMRAVLPKLRPDEHEVLRRIMGSEGALTVADVFPDFARESEGHKTLRRLRAAQFVRPAGPGHWDRGVVILVKPFARLMWNHLGEDGIFPPRAAKPQPPEAPPAAEAAAPNEELVELDPVQGEGEGEDVVDLASVPTEEPPTTPAAGWDEDAALAFLNDPEDEMPGS